MKEFICFIILMTSTLANAQFKGRETSEVYLGLAAGLNLFTNGNVSEKYPMFDVDNTSFLDNFMPFVGYKFNSTVSVEIAPAITIAKTYDKPGFDFMDAEGNRYFFKPQNLSLAMIPISARIKIFPFAANLTVSNSVAGLYSGGGLGVAFLSEKYDNFVYSNNNSMNILFTDSYKNTSWTPLVSIFTGWESYTKYGFGIEIGYNFIPTKVDRTDPLMLSTVSNFNNLYFSVKGRLSF